MASVPDNLLDPDRIPLDAFDVSNPDLYQHGLAGAYFARLRAEAPVHYCPDSDVGPFWSVTKFNDILEVDRDHKTFSADSSRGGHLLGYEMWFRDDPDLQMPMIIAMDPPRHDIQRRAVSPVVAAENLEKMEPGIRHSACEIFDSLPENETFNWVDKVSIALTTRTLAVLFDFPFEEQRRLTRWSDVVLSVPGDGIVDSWDQRKRELLEMTEAEGSPRN